jgi:prepilin-type N-terminal cleavage/methylation domain-containing protein
MLHLDRPPANLCAAAPVRPPTGFTLIEVVLASLLLSVGVVAILGTAVHTTRMVVRGRQSTRGVQAASAQLELLRATAATPPSFCAGLSDGSDSSDNGLTRRWSIRSAGQLSELSVVVTSPIAGGRATDSLTTSLRCP